MPIPEFHKYQMSRLLSVRKLSTAHFLSKIQNYETPFHKHDTWEFVYCESGAVEVFNDANVIPLGEHQIIFHFPNQAHRIRVGAEPSTLFIMSFGCSSKNMKLFQNSQLHVNSEQRRLLRLIVQELYNAFELEDGKLLLGDLRPSNDAPMGSEQMVSCYLEGLLVNLLRSSVGRQGKQWNPTDLEDALENRIASNIKTYINEHISEHITLETLSAQFHYSRSYLTAQFRKSTGMSIVEYLSQCRIEQAKQQLLDGEATVAQISEALGYSSMQYFSQCFKQAVGCCPSEYAASQDPFAK